MTRERGIVISIEEGTARVALIQEKAASCGSCAGCGGHCTVAPSCVDAPAPKGVHVDDEVVIEIPGPGTALSALLVFLAPAVLFIGGMLCSKMLQNAGILPGGTGIAVIVAFVVTALYFVGIALYDHRLRRSPEHRPRVVEVKPRRGVMKDE